MKLTDIEKAGKLSASLDHARKILAAIETKAITLEVGSFSVTLAAEFEKFIRDSLLETQRRSIEELEKQLAELGVEL